jgi:hypothetical protein
MPKRVTVMVRSDAAVTYGEDVGREQAQTALSSDVDSVMICHSALSYFAHFVVENAGMYHTGTFLKLVHVVAELD